MEESQQNLELKLHDLEKKEQTIKKFCEDVVQQLQTSNPEDRKSDDEALKTGLRFIICDQFRTELESPNKQIRFHNLQIISENVDYYKFAFNVNDKTYGIIKSENHNLLFFEQMSQPEQNKNVKCQFKIETENNKEVKRVQKVGSDQPETSWVEARYANGEVYEGEWNSGKINGYGTYTYTNGDKYQGY